MPDVVGQRSEHAQNVLAKANFTPLVEVVDSAEPKGMVVAQTPGRRFIAAELEDRSRSRSAAACPPR